MASTAGFPLFNWLPAELRLMIWEFAVPENEPEICVVNSIPPHVNPHGYSHNLTVDISPTAYPTIMGVCRESRALALKFRGFTVVILGFRWPDLSCQLAIRRAYQPDMDVLLLRSEYMWDRERMLSLDHALRQHHEAGLRSVRMLAVLVEGFFEGFVPIWRVIVALGEAGFDNLLHIISHDDFSSWLNNYRDGPRRQLRILRVVNTD